MKALTDTGWWNEHWWTIRRPERLRWLYRDQDYETIRLIHRAAKVPDATILEVGGGGSRILPYLGWKFGHPVFGADFSFLGCRLLRENSRLQGIESGVVCDDLFQSSLRSGAFDVVYSCGLIEHFDDQRNVIAAHLRLVKPGGKLILIVPNLEGVQGKIYRRLAPPLWAKHFVFGPGQLAENMAGLGLVEVKSGYLGSFFLHIGRDAIWTVVTGWPHWQQSLVYWLVRLSNAAVSLFWRLSPLRPHTKAFSPLFFVSGEKP